MLPYFFPYPSAPLSRLFNSSPRFNSLISFEPKLPGDEKPLVEEYIEEQIARELDLVDNAGRRVEDLPYPPRRGGGAPVPEPSAALMFGLGAIVMARRIRR